MADEIRIVITDEHPIVRKGLREVIEEEPDLKVSLLGISNNFSLTDVYRTRGIKGERRGCRSKRSGYSAATPG